MVAVLGGCGGDKVWVGGAGGIRGVQVVPGGAVAGMVGVWGGWSVQVVAVWENVEQLAAESTINQLLVIG